MDIITTQIQATEMRHKTMNLAADLGAEAFATRDPVTSALSQDMAQLANLWLDVEETFTTVILTLPYEIWG